MSTRPPSRVVFVGNIPYGLSEEQITEIFNSVGKVEKFRLVYDSESGRPKGFGFAEYLDPDSASSAVRNLNDYEIMGRKLRVDFSNEQKSNEDGHNQGSGSHQASGANGAGAGNYSQSTSIPQLPPGKELPPGVKCTDAISQTLNTLPPSQLLDILAQMKTLATTEPQRATELLSQAPQLGAAIFQALLLMGLVSPEAIQLVVQGGPPPPQASSPTFPPPHVSGYQGAPVANSTPPVPGAPYAPPPAHGYGAPPAPVSVAAAAPVAAPPAQDPEALMRAVLELTEDQISMLPEAERSQIRALRAQFGAQRR